MKRFLVSWLLSAACVLPSYAADTLPNGKWQKCTVSDAWKGPDKTKHIIVGSTIGAGTTLVTKEPLYGVVTTVVVAGLKEAYDRRGYGTCSLQDFVVTIAAGTAAAYGVNWFIVPRMGKMTTDTTVYITKTF